VRKYPPTSNTWQIALKTARESVNEREREEIREMRRTNSIIDASSALIRNVQVATHPSLSLQHGLNLDIPPSATLSQQSITINLPASHNLLTIRPTLVSGTAQRHVKMVALVGMQRLHPSAADASGLAYDIPLHPGTTKVDLEAIAGPARGVPKTGPPGSEIDYERVTIFLNLLR
jgi:chromatin structure-remodeling complex subunit RSC4